MMRENNRVGGEEGMANDQTSAREWDGVRKGRGAYLGLLDLPDPLLICTER
jgi:hypothetical protein